MFADDGWHAYGRRAPLWQVKQVTRLAPPKLFLLTAFTISIMRRAISFWGLGIRLARFVASLSWQYGQPTPTAASNITIVGLN